MQLVNEINWEKVGGLIPSIIQDANSGAVLMLGYMNCEALQATIDKKFVTFFSRSKQRLWMKGEVSGNRLSLREITLDCDHDSLLVQVDPCGNTCHQDKVSCFSGIQQDNFNTVKVLQEVIKQKMNLMPEKSYTADLMRQGINKIAQKVGEEAVEVVVAALAENKEAFVNESADLLYHLILLLSVRNVYWEEVLSCLEARR